MKHKRPEEKDETTQQLKVNVRKDGVVSDWGMVVPVSGSSKEIKEFNQNAAQFNKNLSNMGITICCNFFNNWWNGADREYVYGNVLASLDECVDYFRADPRFENNKQGVMILSEDGYNILREKGFVPEPGVEIGNTGTCWIYDEKNKHYLLFFSPCKGYTADQYIQLGGLECRHPAYFQMSNFNSNKTHLVREEDLGDPPALDKIINAPECYIYKASKVKAPALVRAPAPVSSKVRESEKSSEVSKPADTEADTEAEEKEEMPDVFNTLHTSVDVSKSLGKAGKQVADNGKGSKPLDPRCLDSGNANV